MKLISHRGNIAGVDPKKENHPDYIIKALSLGYNVEVDVWFNEEDLWLGHDYPQYKAPPELLKNERLWIHAKNPQALAFLLHCAFKNVFWHEKDAYTLVGNGAIWTYPKKELTPLSICVHPEKYGYESKKDLPQCLGVCSDNINNYR
jgi:hypothetical protein